MGGASLRYLVGGAGPPLVLVHGLAGAASNWVELAPLLARRHRLLIVELPGHGGSEPLAAAPTLDPYADCVVELARLEGMRARVARRPLARRSRCAAGRRRGTRSDVAAVVLLARGGDQLGDEDPGGVGHARAARAARPRGRAVSDGDRRDSLGPVARLRPLAGRRSAGALGRGDGGVPRRGRRSTPTSGRPRSPSRPRTSGSASTGVRCPCLLRLGRATTAWCPLGDGFDYARRLRAPLRVIAGCGHLLIGERPGACAHAIETFLDRVGDLEELPLEPELAG